MVVGEGEGVTMGGSRGGGGGGRRGGGRWLELVEEAAKASTSREQGSLSTLGTAQQHSTGPTT
jgi:hypothetical protein